MVVGFFCQIIYLKIRLRVEKVDVCAGISMIRMKSVIINFLIKTSNMQDTGRCQKKSTKVFTGIHPRAALQ